MTDLAPLRKVLILCAAAAVTLSLSACDGQNLRESLAKLKEVPVDDSGVPADRADARSIGAEDVELVVSTAKDIAVGEGGLLKGGDGPIANPRMRIAIVDPLKMPPDSSIEPLDTGVGSDRSRVIADPAPAAVKTATVDASSAGRLIQVGSFGSVDAAQNAWQGLQARYPGVEQYQPTYQKITTASGKPMVRLKLGPVKSDNQARSLCLQLDIRDNWCAKAG